MLWVNDHYKYLSSYSAGINFRRQNLSDSDVYRRQILTTKVDPRAVRVKVLSTTICFFNQFYCHDKSVTGNKMSV